MKPLLLHGVTVPSTAIAFLDGQLAHLRESGWEVELVVGEPGAEEFATREGARACHLVPARRDPSAMDLLTFVRLVRLMVRQRPRAVVMGTPKMGVFGTLAAFVARVPVRVYLVHGVRVEGLTGGMRVVLRALERLAGAAATDVVAVSDSVAKVLTREKLVAPRKIHVLGRGSANGIDPERFQRASDARRAELRAAWDVPTDAFVVACVGRVTGDKGIVDLPHLWRSFSRRVPSAVLVLAGTAELRTAAEREAFNRLVVMSGVHYVGQQGAVQDVFGAADAHLLMSVREGLCTVALEASACEVPTVAYGVTGVVDVVDSGETGTLVERGDLQGIEDGLVRLAEDARVRTSMGREARRFVLQRFRREDVWGRWSQFLGERMA